MNSLRTFRHEYKYVIPYEDFLKIRSKFDKTLILDQEGVYPIRSLYFDTYDDNDYYDKQNGVMNRKKIRLRIYDIKSDFAKIEIKGKYDYHQLKESLIISKEEAKRLIDEDYDCLDNDDELSSKIYRMLRDEGYKPKVIIEYNRLAYVTSLGNRITFDFDIKQSYDIKSFYKKEINYYNITDGKDIVMEVKFDRFLEPYVSKILEKYLSRYQSVSKYVLGRNV